MSERELPADALVRRGRPSPMPTQETGYTEAIHGEGKNP